MGKKRTAGEGSVFQDDRGYWNVQIPLRRVRGRMTYKRIRCKTLAGLHQKRKEFERKVALGLVVTTKCPTVETFLQEWLTQTVPMRNRYSTVQSYQQLTRDYLIPHLGSYQLDELERKHVQAMINTIARERAPRTVRNVRAVLRRALNVAMRDGLVNRNVANLVDLPRAAKPKIRTLTAEEARRLLAAIEQHRLRALYWTALLLGLREGELCGLRLEDLNLEAATLHPGQAVQRQEGKLVFVPLKTDASQESLPVPKPLLTVLRTHIAALEEQRSVAGWREHGLLFPSEVGTPLEPRNLVRHFKAVLKAAALPNIPFHNLRHTCGTLLAVLGAHPRMIQAVLRHASHHTTMMYYVHADTSTERAAVEGLGTLLGSQDQGLSDQKGVIDRIGENE
jgi:integrase